MSDLPNGTDIVIRPLELSDRAAAGRVLAAAFPDKMAALLGDRRGLSRALRGEPYEHPAAAPLFADLLHVARPPVVWVADAGGTILGVLEVRDPARPVDGGSAWRVMRARLGIWRAPRARLFFAVFHSGRLRPQELHIDAVAVAPRAQGRGVGSALVRSALTEAARRQKQAVTLYCIDRNDGARRLYERCGFAVVKRERLGPLRHLLGFAATDLMRAQVTSSDAETAGSGAGRALE